MDDSAVVVPKFSLSISFSCLKKLRIFFQFWLLIKCVSSATRGDSCRPPEFNVETEQDREIVTTEH